MNLASSVCQAFIEVAVQVQLQHKREECGEGGEDKCLYSDLQEVGPRCGLGKHKLKPTSSTKGAAAMHMQQLSKSVCTARGSSHRTRSHPGVIRGQAQAGI